MIVIDNKIYAQCEDCRKLVRLNKPLFGSMHVCLSDEERSNLDFHRQLLRRQELDNQLLKLPGEY